MGKKLNHKNVNDFVSKNSDCVLLSDKYINSSTKMDFMCGCGNLFETTFSKFKHRNKRQCNYCGIESAKDKQKLDYSFVKKEMERDGCVLLSDYSNELSTLVVRCQCGLEFETYYKLFTKKTYRLCNNCTYKIYNKNNVNKKTKSKNTLKKQNNKTKKKTKRKNNKSRTKKKKMSTKKSKKPQLNKKYQERIIDFIKNEYKDYALLSNVFNSTNKIMLFHKVCKNIWFVRPCNILHDRNKCPHCSKVKNTMYTQEEINTKLEEAVCDEYSLLGRYRGLHHKTKIKHNYCGYTWKVSLNHFFYNNSRCPKCAASKGERKISEYLLDRKIKFKKEYTFENLLSDNKRHLRFDFAILDSYDNLVLLIEYDGEQHYHGWRGKPDSLRKIQKNDKLKNNYCKEKNIKLIRIPYWDFSNLEEILDKIFK